eukprot:SAG31_NODE_26306_length_444_cov_1.371014_1_plen_36_part_10
MGMAGLRCCLARGGLRGAGLVDPGLAARTRPPPPPP